MTSPPEGSDVISAYFDFLLNHSSMISQVGLHFVHARLSSSNKIVMYNRHIGRTRFTYQNNYCAHFLHLNPLGFRLRYNRGLQPCLCNFYFDYLKSLKWLILFPTLVERFCIQCIVHWIVLTTNCREWYCIFIAHEVVSVLVKIFTSTYTPFIYLNGFIWTMLS